MPREYLGGMARTARSSVGGWVLRTAACLGLEAALRPRGRPQRQTEMNMCPRNYGGLRPRGVPACLALAAHPVLPSAFPYGVGTPEGATFRG